MGCNGIVFAENLGISVAKQAFTVSVPNLRRVRLRFPGKYRCSKMFGVVFLEKMRIARCTRPTLAGKEQCAAAQPAFFGENAKLQPRRAVHRPERLSCNVHQSLVGEKSLRRTCACRFFQENALRHCAHTPISPIRGSRTAQVPPYSEKAAAAQRTDRSRGENGLLASSRIALSGGRPDLKLGPQP